LCHAIKASPKATRMPLVLTTPHQQQAIIIIRHDPVVPMPFCTWSKKGKHSSIGSRRRVVSIHRPLPWPNFTQEYRLEKCWECHGCVCVVAWKVGGNNEQSSSGEKTWCVQSKSCFCCSMFSLDEAL
jgi:hypothetical protein